MRGLDKAMDVDPVLTSVRQAKREQRLEHADHCAICGIRNIEVLRPLNAKSRKGRALRKGILERHHVCGRRNDPDLVIALCLNCHAIFTERQLQEGLDLMAKNNILDRSIAQRRTFAVFLRDAATSVELDAEGLIKLKDWLDENHPSWADSVEGDR